MAVLPSNHCQCALGAIEHCIVVRSHDCFFTTFLCNQATNQKFYVGSSSSLALASAPPAGRPSALPMSHPTRTKAPCRFRASFGLFEWSRSIEGRNAVVVTPYAGELFSMRVCVASHRHCETTTPPDFAPFDPKSAR